ncbi:TauD/TfdA family dioxygenase [Streptomyces sp. DH41]|uniref:TauD/TfdA family dioxygenase n=1 Tax=Streptomyces sp. DH41 TaxID=3040125 RepID=UPI00244131E8|nr:TauD/TfdA family dioxygenase [Streptomyces sp. DH41]MDG9724958.1 TauD/TfdA family dioxygenase [Streptomyces sp. DH41]
MEHVRPQLARLNDAVRGVEPSLPRFRLNEGDILVLDHYRCWHGRDGRTGERKERWLRKLPSPGAPAALTPLA